MSEGLQNRRQSIMILITRTSKKHRSFLEPPDGLRFMQNDCNFIMEHAVGALSVRQKAPDSKGFPVCPEHGPVYLR